MANKYDFSKPLPFRRMRASTYARDGSNQDAVYLAPGQSWAARMDGPGEILHIWFSCQSDNTAPYLQNLRLLAWFDGAAIPQVNTPANDLFGLAHGKPASIANAAFDVNFIETAENEQVPELACFNLWLPMPYAESARLEFRNEGDHPLWFGCYIDYACHPSGHELGPYHFHATHHEGDPRVVETDETGDEQLNNSGEDNYPLLGVEQGEGTYLGTILNVRSTSATRGVWHDGDDMIFVDSNSWPPCLHGTGTLDYFGLASARHLLQTPYYGVTCCETSKDSRQVSDGIYSVYRLHLADPVPFRKSIYVSFEHGHANSCDAHYSSVALWYGVGRDTREQAVAHDENAQFGNSGRI